MESRNYDLTPVRDRLRRANEHLAACRSVANELWTPNESRVRRVTDARGAEHIYYAVGADKDIAGLSLVVSDCLHQLRSALDNLVYLVVLANCKAEGMLGIPSAKEGMLAFPLCRTPEAFNASRDKIWNVGTAVEQIIEGAQPYVALSPAEVSPLWKLRKLQDIDKHRFVLSVGTDLMHSTHVTPPGYEVEGRYSSDPRFIDGIELARFLVEPPSRTVDLEYAPALGVTFEDGLPAEGNPVDSLLAIMLNDISLVVTRVGELTT